MKYSLFHNYRTGWWSLLVLGLPSIAWAAQSEPLPDARTESDRSLEETIEARRSIRSYRDQALTREQLAQLCWAAQGITEPRRGLRASPSAGATYPLELYVATADGVYRYAPDRHELEEHLDQDVRRSLRRAALDQASVEQAPAVFVIAADIRRTARRYGGRAERYVLIEVGHASQNLLLQAVALDLGGVPIGAFDDDGVAQAVRVPDGQQVFYLIPVGYPE